MFVLRYYKLSTFLALILIFLSINPWANAQRKMEALDVGGIAMPVSGGIYISWRINDYDPSGVYFDILRDGAKINESSVTGATNYTDTEGTTSSQYTIKKFFNGTLIEEYGPFMPWGQKYLQIPVEPVNGVYNTYHLNDASVGDLDGDGQYEIVVKRLPNNTEPESTDYTYLEAYELDGTLIWRINLGPNINNAVETNFLVYDFDEDGKAEIATRTSDGMIDGTGVNIGDRDNDGTINYRYSLVQNSDYYRIAGPDYISIFDGETGKELAWDVYIERDPLVQWGSSGMSDSQLGHRATKCMWTVAYLDGKRPSMVNSRGIYHRIKMEAWDWDGTNLSKRWAFDSGTGAYYGQGNHQLSCGDVDDDGKDEIVYGSMTVDHDGTGLYSTGTGHGDALHVSDMDPHRPGLEIWNCLEGSQDWGATYRDGPTGDILIRYRSNRDCGRAAAGDINPDYPGFELWAATECPMYDIHGNIVGTNNVPQNFMTWWDGDLSREFFNYDSFSSTTGYGTPQISKYNPATKDNYAIFTASGTATNNWTKGTPCLQADIFGDWREELMVRTPDNRYLRIYASPYETNYRIPTLMHDSHYRIAISWQNNSYNQPPHIGYYLGSECDDAPGYGATNNRLVWGSAAATWDKGTTSSWTSNGAATTFNDGDNVIFEFTGNNQTPVSISGTLAPADVLVRSFGDYVFEGDGKLTGSMQLNKAGSGTLSLNNAENDYSGLTRVSQGSLIINGNLSNSKVEVNIASHLFVNGSLGAGLRIKKLGHFSPGSGENLAGETQLNGNLEVLKNGFLHFDLTDENTGSTKTNDKIIVAGDVNIESPISININRLNDSLQPGSYALIEFSGAFTGSLENLILEGIPDVAAGLAVNAGSITLDVQNVRAATDLVWNGAESSVWDFAGAKNWLNEDEQDWFLGNDRVIFNESGSSQPTVNITEVVPVGSILVEGSTSYLFNGEGSISGTGGLTKNGSGKLFIYTTNSYTGPTNINEGLIQVGKLTDGGKEGPLGMASADPGNFNFNGGILKITPGTSGSNRNIRIDQKGATFILDNGANLSLNGSVSGSGQLTKDGDGQLSLFNSNSYSGGTVLNSGVLRLATETAAISGLGTGGITIKNATLDMANSTSSYTDVNWNMDIPAGSIAYLNLDGRCTMNGNLTGSGTLNIYTPWIRSDLMGNWSAFEGTINASTDGDGGWLILGNNSGYSNASIHLGDRVTALYQRTQDATIEIGELTGTAGSVLGSGGQGSNTITWKIGGKNTSSQFNGLINNAQYKNSGSKAALIKTGSGRWTLTGSNSYTGGTTVEKGSLLAENSTGSATGTGAVAVQSSALLGGSGAISGNVVVNKNGYLAPGSASGIGTLNLNGNLVIKDGGYLLAKVDANAKTADNVFVSNSANIEGAILYLNKINGNYQTGDEYRLIYCNAISGNIGGIVPATPGEGLKWDVSKMGIGIIMVDEATGLSDVAEETLDIYPNPSNGLFKLNLGDLNGDGILTIENLSGKVILQKEVRGGEIFTENLENIQSGFYTVTVSMDNKTYVNKLIIE